MKLGGVVVVLAGLASAARADGPSLEGRLGVGLRTSSTSDSSYGIVGDDTSSLRPSIAATIGVRLDRFVVGLHAGIAAPLHFFASELADSGEQVPSAESAIYPLDLGVSGETRIGVSFWLSAWLGATVDFTHATSQATFVNAIDYYGQIPAATWRYRTMHPGGGAAFGYDFARTEYGRLATVLELEVQDLGPVATRSNRGVTGMDTQDLTSTSFTFGLAYSY